MKKLFESNIKLVYKVFHEKIEKRIDNQSMKDDLIQIGMLSLWKCCLKYDPSRGVQFSTYAYNAIQKSMMCALVREKRKTAILVSLSKPIQSDSDDCSIVYEDVIASSVNIVSEVEINDMVEQISKTINSNAEKVISMIREGHTQVDIAKELNITRASVGKILKKFRKSLKNTLFFED